MSGPYLIPFGNACKRIPSSPLLRPSTADAFYDMFVLRVAQTKLGGECCTPETDACSVYALRHTYEGRCDMYIHHRRFSPRRGDRRRDLALLGADAHQPSSEPSARTAPVTPADLCWCPS